jgi:hypothetical protein
VQGLAGAIAEINIIDFDGDLGRERSRRAINRPNGYDGAEERLN